jgi:hypothetical protein
MGALIARPRADLVSPVVEPALVPAAPIVREEMASAPAVAPATANPQPSQIPESRIAPPVSEQAKRPESVPVATGLTRKNASEGEPMSVEQQTVAELDEKFAIEVPDLNSQGRPTGRRITIKGPAAPDRYPADLLKRCILEDDANDTGFRQWLDSCDKRNMEAKLRRSRR